MPRKSTTGNPSRKPSKSSYLGGAPVHGTAHVELPTRRPRHPREGEHWRFASTPDAAVEAAHELLKARCAMSPVPLKTLAAEGLTSGTSPKVVRADHLAAEWPTDAGAPPLVAVRAMPPEMQADGQRILDCLPAYPWSADPAGVYSRSGEYLIDTGGDDALARQVARLPELLDAAVREVAEAAEYVHRIGVAFQDSIADVKENERDATARAVAPPAWKAGWALGYAQAVGRVRDAAGDAAEAERGTLDARALQLRDTLDTLQRMLTVLGAGAGAGVRRSLRGCKFRGWCPAGARWWGVPRPPGVPGWQRTARAVGRTYAALGTAHGVVLARVGFGIDDFLLAARDALGAVENALANAGKEAAEPSPYDGP